MVKTAKLNTIVFVAITAIIALPVMAGLKGTILPAFYYFPALGQVEFSLQAFRDLFAYEALGQSIILTLTIGWGAVLLSFALAFLLLLHYSRLQSGSLQKILSLFISVPHSAFAIGFLFLLIPNGWLLRLVSPWLTGYDRPPVDWLLPDIYGITALVGLTLKEVPFFLLLWLSALRQFPANDMTRTAMCLGYSERQAWVKVVFPQIYKRSRLAVFAVLAYSLSVVDVPLILSASPVSVLSVNVLRWSVDADTTYYFTAAAGALLQMAIVCGSFAVWLVAEKTVAYLYKLSIHKGRRKLFGENLLPKLEAGAKMFFGIICFASIITLPLFAFSDRWNFPQALPYGLSLRHWQAAWDGLWVALWNSLSLGIASASIALLLSIILLEIQNNVGKKFLYEIRKLLFLPLLIPQVAFLLGIQMILLQWNISSFAAVLLCHLLFVLPYMIIVLSDSYLQYDDRNSVVGKTLGRFPFVVFVRIKLALLFPALAFAFAVGFAVSVGQYLPTVFGGSGRFATLTTEAITLAAGGNRGTLATFALWQSLLPLLAFLLVIRKKT